MTEDLELKHKQLLRKTPNTPTATTGNAIFAALGRKMGDWARENPIQSQKPVMAPAKAVLDGVPSRYRGFKLSDFAPHVKEPVDWSRNGFCLRGPTGNGKSSLAAALVRDRVERQPGLRFEWISVPLFVERIKSAAKIQANETAYQILLHYRKAHLIVIDDLGKERGHDWDKSALVNLIWQAYDHKQDLIITTNLKLSEIKAENEALASRLGWLAEITLPNVNRRTKQDTG